jgi:hypothetical protein
MEGIMDNRPRGRDKNVIGGSGNIQRRGNGLGTGPVGGLGRTGGGRSSSGTAGTGNKGMGGYTPGSRRSGGSKLGGKAKLYLVVLILFMLFGGGGYSIFGNSDSDSTGSDTSIGSSDYSYTSTGSSSVTLDTTVAEGSRDKYTAIKGNGSDVVTIMVYMCGTDLESKSGMATSDLQEMAAADISDNINLIVYTGGCKEWKNSIVSSSVNQIYKIENGGMTCLENNMGTASMTKPATLTEFIKYCDDNFRADRYELILWDHGGGSLSGYGYDEKNSGSGSMDLAGINTALTDAGVKFDFIGFDACLMATMENALMLTKHADYMIASEETEPGVGWYYTNWLTDFSKNTSKPTIEVGKQIVDDFVDVCAKKCSGQKTTLSVVDLAEIENTVPDKLTAFAGATSELIENNNYKTVSNARYNTREFAQSSQIDQVDLVNLAQNMNTSEGEALAEVLKGAVKYNRYSTNMSNANGISIYFPYKTTSKVKQAVSAYEELGMDEEYTKCIQQFAGVETGGQTSAGGSDSSLSSLMGSLLGNAVGSSTSSSGSSADMIAQLLGNMLSDRQLDTESTVQYLADNYFDASQLEWTEENGSHKLKLSEEQWSLVQGLDLNVFYDDGSGYVDLGLDNVYEFDDEGNLIGDYDRTWLSINGQPVAYYHLDTVENGDDYSITGYVPAFLNGDRVELILVFDNDNPYGYIAGARSVYTDGETDTVAKNMTEVKAGDVLDFICDYYSYDGTYQDSYYLGDTMTLGDDVVIGNIDIGSGAVKVTYKFTDIYNQSYWTPAL